MPPSKNQPSKKLRTLGDVVSASILEPGNDLAAFKLVPNHQHFRILRKQASMIRKDHQLLEECNSFLFSWVCTYLARSQTYPLDRTAATRFAGINSLKERIARYLDNEGLPQAKSLSTAIAKLQSPAALSNDLRQFQTGALDSKGVGSDDEWEDSDDPDTDDDSIDNDGLKNDVEESGGSRGLT